jgi:hypothetical protein
LRFVDEVGVGCVGDVIGILILLLVRLYTVAAAAAQKFQGF